MKGKRDIFTQIQRSTWTHLQTELLNTSTLLTNKEKEFLKGNSKKQIKRHCHLTGYLHAQRGHWD